MQGISWVEGRVGTCVSYRCRATSTWVDGVVMTWLFVASCQVCSVLHQVCRKEGLSLPPELAQRVAEKSKRNMRKALLLCEACRVQQ